MGDLTSRLPSPRCRSPTSAAAGLERFCSVRDLLRHANFATRLALFGEDAKDCARLAELFECGLLRGSYIPPAELKEVRDLTRYRIKTVQARTSEIQRLGKALESAG